VLVTGCDEQRYLTRQRQRIVVDQEFVVQQKSAFLFMQER